MLLDKQEIIMKYSTHTESGLVVNGLGAAPVNMKTQETKSAYLCLLVLTYTQSLLKKKKKNAL